MDGSERNLKKAFCYFWLFLSKQKGAKKWYQKAWLFKLCVCFRFTSFSSLLIYSCEGSVLYGEAADEMNPSQPSPVPVCNSRGNREARKKMHIVRRHGNTGEMPGKGFYWDRHAPVGGVGLHQASSDMGFGETSAAFRKYLTAGNCSIPTTHHFKTPHYTLIRVTALHLATSQTTAEDIFSFIVQRKLLKCCHMAFCLFFLWQQPFQDFEDWFNSFSWSFNSSQNHANTSCFPILWLWTQTASAVEIQTLVVAACATTALLRKQVVDQQWRQFQRCSQQSGTNRVCSC